MSAHTINFPLNLKDRVLIKAIDRPAVVEGILIDYLGVQYQVSYWDNCERKRALLPVDELQEIPKPQ